MSALIKVTPTEHGVVTVSLDRPDVRNALSATLLKELASVLAEIRNRKGLRVLVLAGEGRDFCAGADLADMKALGAASQEKNQTDARQLGNVFHSIHDFPRPVVARVQGNVFGGGVGLVAACDLAVVADDARFAFTEVRLGILPAVISPYVVQRIGDAHARRLFLTGERFSADRALAIGLASEVVPLAELDEALGRVLHDLLLGSPDAQDRIKRLLALVSRRNLDEASTRTPQFIAEARASAEGQEGLAAFLEKRKPSWVDPGSSS